MNEGNIWLITLAGYGITIDHEEETDTSYSLWISVPEHSYQKDVDGNEMAGDYLARRVKTMLKEFGVKNLTVYAKIRKGVYWTEDDSKNATNQMGRSIYRSQWTDQ